MGAQDLPRPARSRTAADASRAAYRPTLATSTAASSTATVSAHMSGIAPCWVTTQAATGGLATMLIRWARSCQASGSDGDTRSDPVSDVGEHGAGRRTGHRGGCADDQAADAQVHDR